jgi:hypothetical protein
MKNIKEYLKAEDVEFFLANTPQITFEGKMANQVNIHFICKNNLSRLAPTGFN